MNKQDPPQLGSNPAEFEDETPQKSPFRDVPRRCECPRVIKGAVESLGTTCQDVFRKAMHIDGYPEPFSRAVFVNFCLEGKTSELIPKVVSDYCRQVPTPRNTLGRGMEKCMGCWLDKHELVRLRETYIKILPEVNVETLERLSKSRVRSTLPVEVELNELERAWADILRSDALDSFDDSLDSLMRNNEDDSE